MPKSCGECEFNYNLEGGSYEWWECVILHDDINQFDTRRTDCPLIEIPDEIWEALKPKVDTMSMALKGWVEDVLKNKNGFGVDS